MQPYRTARTENLPQWQKVTILVLALLFVAGLFVRFFYSIEPEGRLAFDRRILHGAMQNWVYGTGMSNPPWSMALIYPFEQLPLQLTWGLLAFLLFTALIAWIPSYQGWTRYVLLIILPISWITLRNYAEGNYEAFVLWGLYFIWLGLEQRLTWLLALGILLATIKPQLCTLLLPLLLWYTRHWERRALLTTGAILTVVTIPSLLFRGQAWIDSLDYFANERGTQEFLGFEAPPLVYFLFRVLVVGISLFVGLTRTRISFAVLVSGSLLISPYIGGLSMVTILGVGVGAVFAAGWWLAGFAMLVMFQDIPTLSGNGFEGYWFMVLLFVWGILLMIHAHELPETSTIADTP